MINVSFGKELSKEFEKLVNGKSFSEIKLCTKLEDAFINLSSSHSMLVEVIHGSKSMVEFEYNASYISTIPYPINKRCELGDMLFIVFSKKNDTIRLMYMQNKKGDYPDRFKADLIQLDLLNRKPIILSYRLPKCVFGDKYILKDAILPSVTSYGIFYNDSGRYNMSYLIATKVLPENNIGVSQKRIAKYNFCGWGVIDSSSGFEESQGEKTIECFGDALFDMKIGSPIINLVTLNNIKNFLAEYSFVWRNGDLPNKSFQIDDSIPSICIINADFNWENPNREEWTSK